MSIRTRFAPSPTGHVHIGNIRAAIYTWLFARHEGGQFLLRIEDTDRARSTPEAVQAVFAALEWLGLQPDEEPLYQSTRVDAHLAAAEQLLRAGQAYREDKGDTGRGECVVFRMPGTDMTFHDEIKGELRKAAANLSDFVIVRSDGAPVFHLANVVDDIHMGVTHVIRGDDHIENTYRHVALFQALGAAVPKYAHLPMIVNAQGKPYSKRDGAAYVGEFRERGYLPVALLNYLVLLGWSPGDNREVLTREEMIALFHLNRVQSSPAKMDLQKLSWMNGEHMVRMPIADRLAGARAALAAHGLDAPDLSDAVLGEALELMGERVKLFSDLPEQAAYLFTEDYPFDDKAVRKRLCRPGAREGLAAMAAVYAEADSFTPEATEQSLRDFATARGVSAADLVHPVRVAVSGVAVGPSLFHLLAFLGRDRVLQRIARALDRCG